MPIVPTDLLYDFAAEAAPVARAFLAEQAPKAAVVAQARGYAVAHQLAGGAATVSALVGAAIMGAYRSRWSNPSNSGLRGNFTHTRLPSRGQYARPMERAPKRLAIGTGGSEPSGSSGKSTLKKASMRADVPPSGLEIVERPFRLQKTQKGDRPKSVWSSLRDMVSGKKILKNTFSFKMSSERDQRGLMSIPLRHDANLAFDDANWAVGAQSSVTVPATYGPDLTPTPTTDSGYKEYTTMMKSPTQVSYSARPTPSTANVIIPRLNLPTLEQTSWDLNNMKLFPGANLTGSIDSTGNKYQDIVEPVLQLGGSAVPRDYGSNEADKLPNKYPSAVTSYARKQSVTVPMGDPNVETHYQLPRFKTQLGGGSLKMRMCNQGTNSCTVEFVVIKVAFPYVNPYNPAATQSYSLGLRANLTRTWGNLYDTVGWEHSKKVQSNLSYAMGASGMDLEKMQLEPLVNPYKPWLPDSCFKAHYDNTDKYAAGNPSDVGGTNVKYQSSIAPNQLNSSNVNPLAKSTNAVQNTAIPFNGTGGAGQKTPYRVVNRGHCTISGAAERNVTIPIPGSNYDASQLQSVAQTATGDIDSAKPALISDQGYIVLISVNGSLQDIIEPELEPVSGTAVPTDTVKVIGKAYTASVVDFYCQYTETVYPSHCDYSEITPVAYNMGTARTAQVETTAGYPGKILPMSSAVPTVTTGVLRTGASSRAGHNRGTKTD